LDIDPEPPILVDGDVGPGCEYKRRVVRDVESLPERVKGQTEAVVGPGFWKICPEKV